MNIPPGQHHAKSRSTEMVQPDSTMSIEDSFDPNPPDAFPPSPRLIERGMRSSTHSKPLSRSPSKLSSLFADLPELNDETAVEVAFYEGVNWTWDNLFDEMSVADTARYRRYAAQIRAWVQEQLGLVVVAGGKVVKVGWANEDASSEVGADYGTGVGLGGTNDNGVGMGDMNNGLGSHKMNAHLPRGDMNREYNGPGMANSGNLNASIGEPLANQEDETSSVIDAANDNSDSNGDGDDSIQDVEIDEFELFGIKPHDNMGG
jgi:hypothetical protein